MEYDYLFKVVMIGDSGSGKSCLLRRYADEAYDDRYISTIGVDFRVKTIHLETCTVKLQIWDTAGQERFRTITTSYYRGANCIMIMFDLTDPESFENVRSWYREAYIATDSGMADDDLICRLEVPVILVGCKSDLTPKVSMAQIRAMAEEYDMSYFTCSAKTGEGIDDPFRAVARHGISKMPPPLPGHRKDEAHWANSMDESVHRGGGGGRTTRPRCNCN